jgi:hypothetical protein
MDRRTLLTDGLAGGLPAGAVGEAARSSVMLWALTGTFEQKLEIAARAGLESVELTAEHLEWGPAEIARMKKLTRSHGLGWDTILATPTGGSGRCRWWTRRIDSCSSGTWPRPSSVRGGWKSRR